MPLADLFGAARVASMHRYMQGFARSFGVEDMRQSDRLPNTRWPLAVAELARDQGKLEAFRKIAMEAHWRRGLDLENGAALEALATEAGLAPGAAERALADPSYLARIDATRAESHRIGVTGIPTFLIGRERVVGCVPYDELAGAVRRAQAGGAQG
jgi:predicted DsbA family dithiol-disulfide isomerase